MTWQFVDALFLFFIIINWAENRTTICRRISFEKQGLSNLGNGNIQEFLVDLEKWKLGPWISSRFLATVSARRTTRV